VLRFVVLTVKTVFRVAFHFSFVFMVADMLSVSAKVLNFFDKTFVLLKEMAFSAYLCKNMFGASNFYRFFVRMLRYFLLLLCGSI